MKERLLKWAPRVGYPIFYLFCLVLFASWTFPYDKVKERIVVTFNAQQRASNGSQELQIDDLTSSFITGVHASGVHLVSAGTDPAKPIDLKLDDVRARISLLGLLAGDKDVTFNVNAFNGTTSGSYDDKSKEREIDTTFDGVDLAQFAPVTSALGAPMEGKLSGTIHLVMPEGKLGKANGTVALEIADCAIGDGKSKLRGALALPRVNIGPITINADVKDGAMKFTKVSAGGKDLDLQADGKIQLREQPTDSIVDVNLRFKFNDAYRNKNDITKGLFGAPGSTIPGAFDLSPDVKRSKRADGFYGWHAHKAINDMAFDPAPFAGGGSVAPPRGATPAP